MIKIRFARILIFVKNESINLNKVLQKLLYFADRIQ
jgi:hypothetical protein